MRVLAFDTSGPILTVGLAADSRPIARRDRRAERGAGNLLEREIDDILKGCRLGRNDIDGLALITGPGSLTALRIAWATAAGWAQSQGIPVVGWTIWSALHRALEGRVIGTYGCVRYRGTQFLLSALDSPSRAPEVVDLAAHRSLDPAIIRLVGPGLIGHRQDWQRLAGPNTILADEDDAFIGGDTLALWGETDLRDGVALRLSESPLDYGIPPDFKKHLHG